MKKYNQSEAHTKIQVILNKCSKSNYIFRGESKKHEKVASGLYRQYCQKDDNNPNDTPSINNNNFSVFTVEEDIVEKAQQHIRPDATNIEVLTELQHYGGNTALLDFTKDIHIALFFACDGNPKENGRVILFNTSGVTEEKDIYYAKLDNKNHIYTVIPPTGKSPRVIFQSSIFVHTSKGYLEEGKYEIIEIEKELKESILEYLRQPFNITTETIYNDIQGFIRNRHNHSTAEVEFYRGEANSRAGDYNAAIEHYSKSIELNSQHATAYNNRGHAYSALGKHEEAIKDYNKAIALNPQHADAYNNRGAAKSALGRRKEAIKDYDQTIELNPQHANAYYNRGNAKYHLGNYAEAITDFIQAKNLYEQEKDLETASECAERIVRLEKLIKNNGKK